MPVFSRYVIAGACIAAFAVPASAQFNAGAPWGQHALDGVTITSTDRTVVYDDIAHYRYRVQVGAGPYDMVQVHRVVREAEPWKPKGTVEGAFLLPGLPQFFEAIFMPQNISDAAADDHSFAIYLAQNGIDVWGLDWGWDFVPGNFKVSAEGPRLNNCANAIAIRTNYLDQGIFHEQWPLKFIGNLALGDPNGPSPVIPGLTNYEAAVTLGIPFFVTGTVGPPPVLTFTDDRLFVDLIAGTPDFSTRQSAYDMYAAACDDDVIAPVGFDDHLAKISLPIFYVGKNAAHGLYAATLTASTDISQLLVNPPAYPDLAHADLFLAPVAEELVWFPILEWMLAHKKNPNPF